MNSDKYEEEEDAGGKKTVRACLWEHCEGMRVYMEPKKVEKEEGRVWTTNSILLVVCFVSIGWGEVMHGDVVCFVCNDKQIKQSLNITCCNKWEVGIDFA